MGVGDRPAAQVVAEDFLAVEINTAAILTQQTDREVRDDPGIGDEEGRMKPGGLNAPVVERSLQCRQRVACGGIRRGRPTPFRERHGERVQRHQAMVVERRFANPEGVCARLRAPNLMREMACGLHVFTDEVPKLLEAFDLHTLVDFGPVSNPSTTSNRSIHLGGLSFQPLRCAGKIRNSQEAAFSQSV